jgi:hypothetical protein
MMRDPKAVNDWTDWYNMFKADGGKTSGFFGVFTLEDRLKKLEKVAQDTSGQPTQRLKDSFEFIKKYRRFIKPNTSNIYSMKQQLSLQNNLNFGNGLRVITWPQLVTS